MILRLILFISKQNTFCPEKKSPEKYGVSGDKYVLLSEIGEAAGVLLDAKVISLLKKYEDCIDYIHFTDQYAGLKLTEYVFSLYVYININSDQGDSLHS